MDADDERHPTVPEDVVNVLESDLAVEGDRSAEENTPVVSTVPASSGAVRRRLVLTSCTAGTAPASPSALVVAGRAVDVPPTILDALEEDLGRFSPSVRVNWRESNDRVAEVASQTPSRVEVEAPHQFDVTVADSDDEQRDPTPVETPDEVPVEEASTESLCSGASDVDPDAEDEFADVPLPEVEVQVVEFTITREFRAALQSLDDFNLVEVFSRRPSGMRTVPKFMRGGVPQCVASGHSGGIVSRRKKK